MNKPEALIETTESVCPVCFQTIPAKRISRGGDVFLNKECPLHGEFETVVWRGAPAYATWRVNKIHTHPKVPFTQAKTGCPYDCGPCEEHLLNPCCVLLEVTQRCDIRCPVCFADSNASPSLDPNLAEIKSWYERLLETKTSLNIQLSGGEPCVRDDLPEIIALGKQAGFTYFQLNTNGLRLARDINYLKKLKAAGLSSVFLQFDGVSDQVYQAIRGRNLFAQKVKAIENCIAAGVGVVLVPVIIPGVNDYEIGNILQFALKYHPGVRGVHFQPVSYFGRFPKSPVDEDRITLPEIIAKLEHQSNGMVKEEHFKPAQAEHARCTFNGNFVVMPDGSLRPLTRFQENSCCCQPVQAEQARVKGQSFVARTWSAQPAILQKHNLVLDGFEAWDIFIERSKTHSFAISGMAFQDAWTLDLERLKQCKIFIFSPDRRLIPFCAYNLTNQQGESLYRGKCNNVDFSIPA